MKGNTPIQRVNTIAIVRSASSMKKEWLVFIILIVLSVYVIVLHNSVLQVITRCQDHVQPLDVTITEQKESDINNSEANVRSSSESSEKDLGTRSLQRINRPSETNILIQSKKDVAISNTGISEQSATDVVIQSTLLITEQSNNHLVTEPTAALSGQSNTDVVIQSTPAIIKQISTAISDRSGTDEQIQPTNQAFITDATTQSFQSMTDVFETDLTIESKRRQPTSGDSNIIFIETSCVVSSLKNSYGGLYLHQRQACTIESAAKANPESKVYILYTCSVNGTLDKSPDNVKGVLSYPNVKLWKLNFTEFFAGTPLEDWDFYSKIKTSQYPVAHTSDIVRVASLWKWGGTYLDLDIIVFRSLAPLGFNYVASYETNSIANGILNLDTNGTGHAYATICLEDVKQNFQGDNWYQNGPYLVTRSLLKMCNVTKTEDLTPEICHEFKILPPRDFFPVSYEMYMEHYQPNNRDKIINMITGAYGLHLNNNFLKDTRIPLHRNHAYDYMSEKYCPRSYSGAPPML